MKKINILIIITAIILTFTFEEAKAQVSQDEFDALVTLYIATDGDNWVNSTNWSTTINDVSNDWYGITVSDGHVTEIILSNEALIKTGNQTNKTILDLSDNILIYFKRL